MPTIYEQLKQNNKRQEESGYLQTKQDTRISTGDCDGTSISGLRVKQPPQKL